MVVDELQPGGALDTNRLLQAFAQRGEPAPGQALGRMPSGEPPAPIGTASTGTEVGAEQMGQGGPPTDPASAMGAGLAETISRIVAEVGVAKGRISRPTDRVTEILKQGSRTTAAQDVEDFVKAGRQSTPYMVFHGPGKSFGEMYNALQAKRLDEAEEIAKIQIAEEESERKEAQNLRSSVSSILTQVMQEQRSKRTDERLIAAQAENAADRRDANADRTRMAEDALDLRRDIAGRSAELAAERESRLKAEAEARNELRRKDLEIKSARLDTERTRAENEVKRIELSTRDLERKIEEGKARGEHNRDLLDLRDRQLEALTTWREGLAALYEERNQINRDMNDAKIVQGNRKLDLQSQAQTDRASYWASMAANQADRNKILSSKQAQRDIKIEQLKARGFSDADSQDLADGAVVTTPPDPWGNIWLVNKRTGKQRLAGGGEPKGAAVPPPADVEGMGPEAITALEGAVRGGVGPWRKLAMVMDAVAGLGEPLGVGSQFPETAANREYIRSFAQIGKTALVNNPRFPVHEQQVVQRLLPDADAFWGNPDTEAKNLRTLRGFMLGLRKTDETQLGSGRLSRAQQADMVARIVAIDQVLSLMNVRPADTSPEQTRRALEQKYGLTPQQGPP